MSAEALRLIRSCAAAAIPSGEAVTLPESTEVVATQALGGHITVRTDSGLFRIAAENAGAIPGYGGSAVESPSTGSGRSTAGRPSIEFSEDAVWAALKTCFDPEIPVNIVDLGLVYDLSIENGPAGGRAVEVKMTLTAPGCGMGPVIAEDARGKIAALPTVESARVHIVWDPVWTPQMISVEGRKALGLE